MIETRLDNSFSHLEFSGTYENEEFYLLYNALNIEN